jgi:hypothetical protein
VSARKHADRKAVEVSGCVAPVNGMTLCQRGGRCGATPASRRVVATIMLCLIPITSGRLPGTISDNAYFLEHSFKVSIFTPTIPGIGNA